MNHSFFIIFVLAHLIGDFVLQSDKIAKLKASTMKGLIIHVSIVCIFQVLLLSFFGLRGIIAGVICGIIHFFIDYLKTRSNKYFINKQFIYFILDQAVHIFVIYIITLFMANTTSILDAYTGYLKLLISLIILTFVSTIAAKILVRDLNKISSDEAFFKRYERLWDAATAIILWVVWLSPSALSIFVIVAGLYIYRKQQMTMFGYEGNAYFFKYAVLVINTGTVLLFLQ